jgi:hypothetical protein
MWAVIAFFIGYQAFGHRIWGGIVIAPLIGILIGHLSWPLRSKPRWVQIVASLFFLYVAATCFALGTAVVPAVNRSHDVRVSATLIEHVLAVLWGLTFGGYALVLWPLAFFNHRLVWQADARQIPAPPKVHTTSAAIRSLAVRIIGLSIVGCAAWALFQSALATFGSSVSTMPWWVVIGLMGWSKWFILGVFVWLSAPVLAFGATLAAGCEERATATYRELIGVVGFALFTFPIFFFAATLVVTAIKVSLVHSWATEGTVFSASDYYRNVFRMYLPCFLVGGVMIAVRRLLSLRR